MAFITPTLPTSSTTRRRVATSPHRPPHAALPQPTLPLRVIPSPLPNVLVYDHCPFCVRVRFLLGLKNVKHNLIWLLNDDIATPTALVGRKVVPIFQPEGSAGPSFPESLDICAAIDTDPRYGPTGLLKPQTRSDITAWLEEMTMPMCRLTRVRFAKAPLPEFAFQEGRHAFVRNHPLEDPSSFDDNMANSPQYIAQVQARLDELAAMIHSPQHCSPDGLSYDDILLFPRLMALTIVDGLELPKAIRDYVDFQSMAADLPTYDFCAM